jgi:hypothetical protein
MATTWTPAHLAKLDLAIATGTLSVAYDDGRRVVYRSLAEMIQLRRLIEGQLEPSKRGPFRKVHSHSKGVEAGGVGEPFEWS